MVTDYRDVTDQLDIINKDKTVVEVNKNMLVSVNPS